MDHELNPIVAIMDRILSHAAILPRLRANFYMTLPRNAIGLLLGLCMAVAGVMFASGGCTTGGPLFPLAKWLTLFGTLYMLVHLVLIMMGVMMLSYAEHETTNRKHMYDLHMLDIVYLVCTVPTHLFLICFFFIGNTWFFSFDFEKASFVGANALECRQSLTVGTVSIVLVWLSIPACALYIGVKKKLNSMNGGGGSEKKEGRDPLQKKTKSSYEDYDAEVGVGDVNESKGLLSKEK